MHKAIKIEHKAYPIYDTIQHMKHLMVWQQNVWHNVHTFDTRTSSWNNTSRFFSFCTNKWALDVLVYEKCNIGVCEKLMQCITPCTVFTRSGLPIFLIWLQRSDSTLAQAMACCLAAPSHCLDWCWLIITEVQWQSHEGTSTNKSTSAIR